MKPSEKKWLSQVGEQVRFARRAQKLTQQKAAEKAGVHTRLWQKLESGKNATLCTLARAALALGLHPATLLEADP